MRKVKAVFWLVVFVIIAVLESCISPVIKIAAIVMAIFGKGKYKQYGINVWEGEDNAGSARLGGDPDESISSRLGKARKLNSGWGIIADKVDLVAEELFNNKNHCDSSVELDEGRKQVTNY